MTKEDSSRTVAPSLFLDVGREPKKEIIEGFTDWFRNVTSRGGNVRLEIAAPYFNIDGWRELMAVVSQYPLAEIHVYMGVEPDSASDPKLGSDFNMLMNRNGINNLYQFLEQIKMPNIGFFLVNSSNLMHAKVALLSINGRAESALVGSINLTWAAFKKNAEAGNTTEESTKLHLIREWFDAIQLISDPYNDQIRALYAQKIQLAEPEDVLIWMLMALGYGRAAKDDDVPNDLWLSDLLMHQFDGAFRLREIVDKHGGAIVSDEVGLGKTYTAGALLRRNTAINNNSLVVCPASILHNWEKYIEKYGLGKYVELVTYGKLGRLLGSSKTQYSLIVFDEAHLLRNTRTKRWEVVNSMFSEEIELSPDVLLLTATPINNEISDLKTLLRMFVDEANITEQLDGIADMDELFKLADSTEEGQVEHATERLKYILKEVMLKRNRKFVRDNYSDEGVLLDAKGIPNESFTFPEIEAKGISYTLNTEQFLLVEEITQAIDPDNSTNRKLTLAAYQPGQYLLHGNGAAKREFNSERNINHLMRVSLLKALESSPPAFIEACTRMKKVSELRKREIKSKRRHEEKLNSPSSMVNTSEYYDPWGEDSAEEVLITFVEDEISDLSEEEVEEDDALLRDLKEYAKHKLRWDAVEISLHYDENIDSDIERLAEWVERMRVVFDPGEDDKLMKLGDQIAKISNHSKDEAKVIIFAARHASVRYLKEHMSFFYPNLVIESINGSMPLAARSDILNRFSPLSREESSTGEDVSVLITTDVLAEGVNLQQAQNVIHYDLPWNPMRMLQRTGRIDRIGSPHRKVFSRHFASIQMEGWLRLLAMLERKLSLAQNLVGAQSPLTGKADSGVFISDDGVVVSKGDAMGSDKTSPETLAEWLEILHLFILSKTGRGSTAKSLHYRFGSGAILSESVSNNSTFIFVSRFGESRYEMGVCDKTGKLYLGDDAVRFLIQAYESLGQRFKIGEMSLEDSLLINRRWSEIRNKLHEFDKSKVESERNLLVPKENLDNRLLRVLDICLEDDDSLVKDALLVQQRKEITRGIQRKMANIDADSSDKDVEYARDQIAIYAYRNRKLLRRRADIPTQSNSPQMALWLVF